MARLSPPPLGSSPALRWVLLRAFGPADRHLPTGDDPDGAVETATRLGIAARIAARTEASRLRAELGDEAAGRLAELRRSVAGAEMAVDGFTRRVLGRVADLGIPVAPLKYAALARHRVLAPGGRGAADLDLLVPRDRAEALARALRDDGWRSSDGPPPAHHLPALHDGRGGMVEIHHRLPGVTTAAGEAAELAALTASGDLEPVPGSPFLLLPGRPLLLAHLLVHGFVQHGDTPHSYPLLRLAGDLLDLGWDEAEAEDLEAVAARAAALSRDDLEASHVLAARLAAGDLDDLRDGDDPEALLLRHWVAGALDLRYGRALRLRQLRPGLGEPHWGRHLWRTLWLTRDQAETLYGPLSGRGALWLIRLLRPFDLIRRAVHYAWAARRRKT
jgi:hypothetical protein